LEKRVNPLYSPPLQVHFFLFVSKQLAVKFRPISTTNACKSEEIAKNDNLDKIRNKWKKEIKINKNR